MTSKLVVNTIEADTGISSVSFASSISMDSTSKFHFSAAGVDIGADTNINRPAAGVLGFNISGAEKLRIDTNGHLNTSGIVTAANFKSGVTNVHNLGVTLTGGQLDVGSNIKIGTAGVVTATSFVGSGANLTGITQTTINNNANNRVITGSGSANTLEGEANLTYNGSILHNQISAGARNDFSTSADGLIIEKGGNTGLSIDPGSSGVASIYFPNESNHSIASISHNNSTGELRVRGEDHIILSTNNNTERLRITSDGTTIFDPSAGGTLKIGGSSAHTSKIVIADNGGTGNGNCLVEGGDGTDFFTIQSNGNVAFASGKGINFGATADGTGSSQAEIFDDYEEGSWTPAVASGNASFSGMTGRYTKVGRNVSLWYRISGGGSYSGSSALQISGIPFTNNTSGIHPVGTSEFYKIDFSRDYTSHCTAYLSGQNLQWLRNNSGGGSGNYLTINLFYSGAAITGWIQYYTDS